MKAKLILTFVILLSLVVFCSCNKQNNNEALSVEGSDVLDTSVLSTSNKVEKTETEVESETEFKTETESESESKTETETESETETEVETEKDKQQIMKEIYDLTENKQLPIGGWSTPASALRDGYTGVEGSYDEMFKLLAESGINYMITLEEWSSGSWPLESLSSAHKAGMKLYYNCVGMEAPYSLEKINMLLSSEYASSLGGIYVKDEPLLSQLDDLAILTSDIRAGLSDTNLPIFSNLLPTYANSGMIGNDYREYVHQYIEKTNPDILMFDYYPYQSGTGDSLDKMMANIAIGIEEAQAANIPLYTFIQSSGSSGMREPSYEELKLDMHLNLAMGVKGVAYFLCCEHYDNWGYTTMIDYEGNKTTMYNKIAKLNSEINAMKGVYLDYEFKNIIISGYYNEGYTALESVSDSILVDEFEYLRGITTRNMGKIATGCFEGEDGLGFYVVNLDYKKNGVANLVLETDVEYEIWGKDGLMDIGVIDDEHGPLTISLSKGEGVFIKTKQTR